MTSSTENSKHPQKECIDSEPQSTIDTDNQCDEENSSDPTPVPSQSTQETSATFSDIIPIPKISAALEKLGITTPMPVQTQSLPPAIEGQDLVVQAQTGSGKTLAYVLPLLVKLEVAKEIKSSSHTFGLVLVPTRELAIQVIEVINSLDLGLDPVCLIGGEDPLAQKKAIKKDKRIVVGTPGRILDFLKQKALNIRKCRYVVLDEADEMLSMGFLEDVRTILSRLPDKRQGLFISATITPRVDMLSSSFLSNAKVICVESEGKELPPIEHLYCEVDSDLMAKPRALCDLVETLRPRSAIIFCNTKSDTRLVEVHLRRQGFDARRINSELSQSQRNAVMNKLRARELQLLVATDIAARGIDISQIDLVINYTVHEQPEVYIHRTGRTGRAGRSGTAISLVGSRDFMAFHQLQKHTKIKPKLLKLPSDDDVCGARVAHIYEIIRQSEIEIKKRDLITARKLLHEAGVSQEPPQELEIIMAKFCRFSLEHHISKEAKSLDEEQELMAERNAEPQRKPKEKQTNRKKTTKRHEEDKERKSSSNRRTRTSDNRDSSKGASESSPKRESRDSRDKKTSHDTIRLYIGQGLEHEMTPDVFADLAQEFANVPANNLRNLTIRSLYGFVDLIAPEATTLINNLNGIEYNGATLLIEVASTTRRPHRTQHQNRPKH